MIDTLWFAAVVLACGVAGAAVPESISRLPEPMGAVGARPWLAVRTATACAAVGAILTVGLSDDRVALVVVLPLVPPAVLLAVVDHHTHLLPTRVVWPTLALAVGLVLFVAAASEDWAAMVRAAVGGAGVFGLFYTLWWLHSAGMGYGDVRLSAVVGVALGYLGWVELVVGVYAGFLAFAVVAVVRAVVHRDRGLLRVASPYGPYLLGGALAGAVLGDPIWSHLVSG